MSDVRPFFDATDIAGDADAMCVVASSATATYSFGACCRRPWSKTCAGEFLPVLRDSGWIDAD